MDPVPTRYLDRDGAMLAYQVVGDGPHDVVCAFEITQHLDLSWADPHIHALFERGATYARTVYLQRRGFGLSDPVAYSPTVEQQADDILAVMDAVGMCRATLYGIFGTCPAVALVAARHPDRVKSLLLVNPIAQGLGDKSYELVGWTPEQAEAFVAEYREAFDDWGSGRLLELWDAGLASAYNRRLAGLLERCSASPRAAQAYFAWVQGLDATEVFQAVRVPTRVVRVARNGVPEEAVRHVAELVPGAEYRVLPPTPDGASVGESFLPVVAHVEEMATGAAHVPDADRRLTALLFTDLVGSTELLSQLGDEAWAELLRRHEQRVRVAVEREDGRLVGTSGDGTFSAFDGPVQAVRCARALVADARELGLELRAGVHVGEVAAKGQDLTGLAVHVGARVAAAAGPGEVLVTRAVHDLVLGSGLVFRSRGAHVLKGVPGEWELLGLEGDAPVPLPGERPRPGALDRAALTSARRAPALVRRAVRLANAVQRGRSR